MKIFKTIFDGYVLQPDQKLVEVEVKSIKKVKVEYEEA